MAKVSRVLTTLALGAAGGVALTVFLASKAGQAIKDKVTTLAKDYQENQEEIHAEWAAKAQNLKDEALTKYQEVKEQLESGDLSYEEVLQTGREKAQTLTERAAERLAQLRESLGQPTTTSIDAIDTTEDVVVVDDIEIHL